MVSIELVNFINIQIFNTGYLQNPVVFAENIALDDVTTQPHDVTTVDDDVTRPPTLLSSTIKTSVIPEEISTNAAQPSTQQVHS